MTLRLAILSWMRAKLAPPVPVPAPAPAPQPAPAAATAKPARRIILFSDGTGNSSGKLFKTNVWRLYEAMDLGPVDPMMTGGPPRAEQIALYSNGVGTSAFRPLAMLGGVFGIGLKSNILQLYKFLCRNWEEGDEIYLFGFSRGAFTIRLLVGLIASQGILRGDNPSLPPDEEKLAYLARAAYRAFAGEVWPNRRLAKRVSRVVRGARDVALEAHRRFTRRDAYDNSGNQFSDIAFVGVWDTVAAYGGPIIELTRGIDDWIWPLTMPNYQLSPRVRKARHALALDDERDAFQPLLWDEVRELMLVAWGGAIAVEGDPTLPRAPLPTVVRRVKEGRLKQVWFAGMHADVGGGYPDESLSFVSLLWMIDELDGALRLLPDQLQRIRGIANVLGPLHNSRAGLGGYYRYQPRRISAVVDHYAERERPDEPTAMEIATLSLRDPEIADPRYEIPPRPGVTATPEIDAIAKRIRSDHGLLRCVCIHESVIARIREGTDSYAPVSLPQHLEIVYAPPGGVAHACLRRDEGEAIIAERSAGTGWYDRQARTFDMVWWRRMQYFVMAGLSLALATLPWWGGLLDRLPGLCADDRCVVRPVLAVVDRVSGRYAGPWVDAIADHVLASAALIVAIVILFTYGSAYELRLRGRARRAWRQALRREPKGSEHQAPRTIARIRDHRRYQLMASALKWSFWPAVAAAFLILSALNLGAALFAQLFIFPLMERHNAFCGDRPAGPPIDKTAIAFGLDIHLPCTAAPAHVEAREHYAIRVTVLRNPLLVRNGNEEVQAEEDRRTRWLDGATPGLPEAGQGADLPWLIDLVGVPWRRVVLAGWLQPLVHIRAPGGESGVLRRMVLGRTVEVLRPPLACDQASGGYLGNFTPAIDGDLSLFTNEAMVPVDWRGIPRPAPAGALYRNNQGFAWVQVWKLHDEPPSPAPILTARRGGDAALRETFTPVPCTAKLQ